MLTPCQLTLALAATFATTLALPVTYHIEKGRPECLYTSLTAGESITTSIFIVTGEHLRARTVLQGPISPSHISSSAEVLAAAMRLDKLGKDKGGLTLNLIEDLDFESIYNDDAYMLEDDDYDDDAAAAYNGMDDVDDVVFQDYYYYDDDDEYEFMEDDAMDDIEIEAVRKAKAERDNLSGEEKQKLLDERKEKKTARFAEMKKKREAARNLMHEKAAAVKEARRTKDAMREALQEGKPLEHTRAVQDEGWYRFCVEATSGDVDVEFELRKSSELGQPNKKTGHLQTYERHDMMQNERKLMDKLNAAAKKEGGGGAVKEDDLQTTKTQISKMNRLLNEIREKQINERHRLAIHKAVNEHSRSRMVVGALFETVFYIVISGFQVYTIWKLFTGSPILGY